MYAPILKALRARIDHAKAQVGQSARNIDTDNTTLRRWMKAQQQNADDTKARVQNIDTDSAFDRAAARTMADGRLEQRLGIARDLSGTSIKGDDGRFHSVDQKTADAIDAGLAAAPDTKTYTFSDTDGNIHRSAPR